MSDYLVLAPISQLKASLEKSLEDFDKATKAEKQSEMMTRILEILHELKKRKVPSDELRPYVLHIFNKKNKRERHHALENHHMVGCYNKIVYPAPSGIVC